jgi:hypothetical protein
MLTIFNILEGIHITQIPDCHNTQLSLDLIENLLNN